MSLDPALAAAIAGGSGLPVLIYGAARIADRVAFLIGLRMLLRRGRPRASDAVLSDYITHHAPRSRRNPAPP
ncbi:hypothetical protein VA596_00405 [Amycolatopsis sp., V23-08]|uniref:Uncharacterized protein n=1 Tax=Amycolatopsis heterodermiae TaxID=3110235 RepID=A0ABU5QVU0_9PSEU|nr:hypothetical protein [Amycolatopsis sp., V23-08]MEA5357978.1 hypothetical protein [Amycolatopsis sp., V23-08]